MGRCIKKTVVTKIPKAMSYKKRITKLKNSGKQRKAPLKDLYKMLEKGLVCETKNVVKVNVQHKDQCEQGEAENDHSAFEDSRFNEQDSFKEEFGEFTNNNGVDDTNSLYSTDENDEDELDDGGAAELAYCNDQDDNDDDSQFNYNS